MDASARLIILLIAFCNVNGLCPDRWTQYGGSCYYLFEDIEEWPQANFVCGSHKAHLVTIETPDENNFLKSYLGNKQVHHADVWIGGNDMMVEGDWRWADTDEKMTFTDWYPSQPDNAEWGENCMEMKEDFGFRWNDEHCTDRNHYLCERSPEETIVG